MENKDFDTFIDLVSDRVGHKLKEREAALTKAEATNNRRKRAEILGIKDRAERQRAIRENWELFDK